MLELIPLVSARANTFSGIYNVIGPVPYWISPLEGENAGGDGVASTYLEMASVVGDEFSLKVVYYLIFAPQFVIGCKKVLDSVKFGINTPRLIVVHVREFK